MRIEGLSGEVGSGSGEEDGLYGEAWVEKCKKRETSRGKKTFG